MLTYNFISGPNEEEAYRLSSKRDEVTVVEY